MEWPQISGTILGTRGIRGEGDDKFTTTGTLESNRSMTNDNQANYLSAFSEVKS